MAKQLIGLLVVACTLHAVAAAAAGTESSPPPAITMANSTRAARSAYGMLVRKGFPVGILPKGVLSYKVVPNGSFEVDLPDYCMFDVARRYTFYYCSKVAGRIRYRSMSGLTRMVFKTAAAGVENNSAWRPVEGVVRDSGFLSFHVAGGITQKIAAVHFSSSHACH